MLLGVIGCSIGGVARHILTTLMHAWSGDSFPWGTMLVNVVGSALMGASLGLMIEYPSLAYLLLGICGGFTTFSAFSLQNLTLLSEGRRGVMAVYILLSVGLSVSAMVWCGATTMSRYW